MRVLLTGGLGFIGRNFLLHRPAHWEVFSLDFAQDAGFQKKVKNTYFFKVNLSDGRQVRSLAKKLKINFDLCLHLAANGDPALSVPDPAWDLKSTTLSLINVCQYFQLKKMIYLSSGAIYEANMGQISPKSKIDPILPYAISHFTAEQYVRFYHKIGKIKDFVIIRFFGAYGPYEPPRKIYTNLVKAFGIRKEKEYLLRGNGKNFIDAMYIEDAIEGFIKVIKAKNNNLTVDFCKGEHLNINQLVLAAARIFGISVKIKHQGQVPEYNQFYANPDEFERLFGFRAKTSLEEGLKRLYQFLKPENS